MRITTSLVGAAALAALFTTGLASAQLGFAEAGPVSPDNGFPLWYKDTKGLSLDLCLTDPLLCLLDAPVRLTNPGQAFPQNYGGTFPEEAFWQRVDGVMPTNNGGEALVVMALEAAFANGPVAAGDQVAFGRVRIRVDNLIRGERYVVTTPLGVFTFIAANVGQRGINFTDDIGLIPGVFSGPNSATASHAGPFLSWDSDLPVLDAAGREYVGNPGIEHTITGSPTGTNFFRIDGRSIGGPGVNRIQTNTFFVMGLKTPPVAPAGPVANFTSAPNSGTAPLNVSFTDTSTGTITSRLWAFGDNTTSTQTNPSHSYAAGTFSVSLTVTGPGGSNTLTKPNLIVATPAGGGGGNLVLSNPSPGRGGVLNTQTVTGATPGRNVMVITGMVLGASSLSQGGCGAIPIGITNPRRTAGQAQANASGVAVVSFTPPAGSAGKTFHFQAVEPSSCRTSNIVSDVL